MSIIENGTEFVFEFDYDGEVERFVLIDIDYDDEEMPYLFQHEDGSTVWIPSANLPTEVEKALKKRFLEKEDQED